MTLRVDLEVHPSDVSVNRRFVPQFTGGKATGRIILSPSYRSEVDALALQVRQACLKQGWKTSAKACRVIVTTRWPSHQGDIDACLKSVCDALQHGSAIANDRQIVELVARATWRSRDPGIEVEVSEVLE